ncbi:hypothetical protein [Caballeronia grimmiae]|uniref:hypothetical protein n=1 Tax=Caballeronia grimmiae TaxID=1071679 RepID=UPI0038BBD82C
MNTHAFLRAKIIGIGARTRRLGRVDHASVGIRPQDMPYAPSPSHFAAANARLARIEWEIERRYRDLAQAWVRVPRERVLVDVALVERELDRARRAFGLFFEVFAQRGTTFAPALAAHDIIAADCYAAIRHAAPKIFSGPLLKPLSYMEHGYSPATMRRGVTLSRLLGEANPFPIIRIPWDREHPWQAVFLHEVAHNLQADLGIWQENRQAVLRRTLETSHDPALARIYGTWHKEIFADLAALLLGGPAAAWGMADFLAHPAPRTLTFRPGSAHPTAFLRMLIVAEMLRRMGFPGDAARVTTVWRTLYDPARFHRLPTRLLATSDRLIPAVVDEIAYQTRRNLAQRALVDVLPFKRADEEAIRRCAGALTTGDMGSVDLPPRHLVSAASYALASGRIAPQRLSTLVVGRLNDSAAQSRRRFVPVRIGTATGRALGRAMQQQPSFNSIEARP